MVRLVCFIVGCLILGSVKAAGFAEVKIHTLNLSDDRFMGRGSGHVGGVMAADYIADEFTKAGLKPASKEGFKQSFPLKDGGARDFNVVGFLQAKSPTSKSILFTAHYDGLGQGASDLGEDRTFNGALDNAVGVGALITLAKRFSLKLPPEQNLVFVATAAEETGYQGMSHYLAHPVFPVKEITVNLNIDGFNVTGQRLDYFVMPRHKSPFLTLVQKTAENLGWLYKSPGWEDYMDDKFDTKLLLERAIPAVTIWTGNTLPDGTEAEHVQLGEIHSVNDEVTDKWDWRGVDDHLALYEAIAEAVLADGWVN